MLYTVFFLFFFLYFCFVCLVQICVTYFKITKHVLCVQLLSAEQRISCYVFPCYPVCTHMRSLPIRDVERLMPLSYSTGAFRLYDVDNDGFITRAEMYNIVEAICQMVVSRAPVLVGAPTARHPLCSGDADSYHDLPVPQLHHKSRQFSKSL